MKIKFHDGKIMGPSFAGLGVWREDDGSCWYVCRRSFRFENGQYACVEGVLDTIEECFEHGWLAEILEGDLSVYRDVSQR